MRAPIVSAAALGLIATGGTLRAPAAAEEPQLAERVNAAIGPGVALIAGHDWYAEGAEVCLTEQFPTARGSAGTRTRRSTC